MIDSSYLDSRAKIETQTYRTDMWTQEGKRRVG